MDFNDRCAFPDALSAHKRVRYSHGLVLGVGELKTEQNFLLARHEGHQRRLHGYGTGAGLALEVLYPADGPEVRVHPGWGIDPHGHDICVHELQCAKLNQWLAREQQRGDLSSPLDTSGVSSVEAFVVLCYRECETDKVPIPVGPCLSLDKSMVASRIQDAFELRLRSEPPPQVEEDVMRRLGDILSRVSIASGSGGLGTPDELIAEIRALATPPSAPASIPSIPSIPADLVLDPAFAEEILRAGLRVFVTEVRPRLVPDGGACLNGPRDETCLLLGRLVFDVTPGPSGPQVVPNTVVIDEGRRPLLFPTRLLQEGMLSNMLPGAAGTSTTPPFVTVPGPGGPILVPGPGGGGTPVILPGPATAGLITLRPGAANLTNAATVSDFAGLPAIRFRRNSAATFAFSLPAGASAAAPRVRLQWGFLRTGAAPDMALTWELTLRLRAAGEDLLAPAPLPPLAIAAQTPTAQDNRLQATAFVPLAAPPSTQPVLGALTLTLITGAAIPGALEIYVILADLDLGGH
jgi:hypothetical protein